MSRPDVVETPLSECGCCEGTVVLVPADYADLNPPGAPQLHYRAGTQAAFLATMRAAVARAAPMHGLDTHRVDDGVMAVADAWACVLDVLSFYTERIANEGYLRTSTELLSRLELARTVGYERAPGRAAGAALVFTLETGPGSPAEVPIPTGTKVASRPGPGELPQTFETTADLVARPEWNTLQVATRIEVPLDVNSTSLYLDGVVGDVRPGDPLLIVGDDDSAVKQTWALVVVRTVTPLPDAKVTQIAWAADEAVTPTFPTDSVRVYALRQRAALFGFNAPDWRAIPNEVRQHFCASASFEAVAIVITPGSCPESPDGWPGFPSVTSGAGGSIDLDAAYPKVAKSSWVVLQRVDAGGGAPVTNLYRVEDTEVTATAGFALSSKVTRLRLSGHADLATTYDGGRRTTTVFAESEELTLVAAPRTDPVTGKVVELAEPVTPPPPGRTLVVTGPQVDGSTYTEEVVIDEPPDTSATTTLLHLGRNLTGSYERSSVTVYANVAPATHGETKTEILGNGDASTPFQHFTLSQSPLTYVAGPGAGVVSTLEVRVNGIRWTEVPSFIDSAARDRVYVTRADSEGKVTVTFGDGVHGARLPTGTENITASYRVGIGLAGKLGTDQLVMLLTRPLGVRSVTNPSPTGLAADPDSPDALRTNAPLHTRTIDRVVSLTDYEDFVLSLPGYAKAQAGWQWYQRSQVVHLTVACDGGQTLDEKTRTDLVAALVNGGDGFRVPYVDEAEPVTFDAALSVVTEPDRVAGSVRAAVVAALRAQFGFDARSLGQPVASSEVIAATQIVPGVVAVTLTALHLTGTPSTVAPVLTARSASGASGSVIGSPLPPAQLLTINPSGLTVTELIL